MSQRASDVYAAVAEPADVSPAELDARLGYTIIGAPTDLRVATYRMLERRKLGAMRARDLEFLLDEDFHMPLVLAVALRKLRAGLRDEAPPDAAGLPGACARAARALRERHPEMVAEVKDALRDLQEQPGLPPMLALATESALHLIFL
jgi:hypothetical protein